MPNKSCANPGPHSRSTLRIAVSWLCIAATVAITQIPQFRTTQTPPDAGESLSLELMGKYIVGMKSILGQRKEMGSLFDSMRLALQKYKSAHEQLLSVPILAELSGKEAAVSELKRLAASPADTDLARDIPMFLRLYRDGESSLDPQQRASIMRYGWLGKLALSQAKSISEPAREEVLESAFRALFAIGVLTVVVFLALLAGLILLAAAIVLRINGRLRSRLATPEDPGGSLLEAFAIYLTGFLALPALILRLFPGFRVVSVSIAILVVILAAVWPHICGADWKNYRTALGWHGGQGIFREIGAGIVGYIAGVPLLLAAAVVVGIISRHTGIMPVHPIVYQITKSPLHLLFWTLLACMWAPVVEETFFRGALFGYFRRNTRWVASGIFVALLFAIIHPQGWVGVPILATLGFTLSGIREWRGSIIASMSAHALNNASALLFLILVFT